LARGLPGPGVKLLDLVVPDEQERERAGGLTEEEAQDIWRKASVEP
jgi:hypothetical protein